MDASILTRLAKLLRMLTSPHDNEALSAARRACGLLDAEGLDWGDVIGGGSAPELSQDQMRRIHEAGFKAGYEQGFGAGKSVSNGGLWQSGGGPEATTRSQEAGGDYDRLIKVTEAATAGARMSEFEREFIESMEERMGRYGKRVFVSPRQWKVIERIEERLGL